jgi:phosphatidate phosphatase APP1
MRKIILLILLDTTFWLFGLTVQAMDSPIKSDEMVMFFPEVGYPLADGKHWQLRIHGWIYEPDWSSDINIAFRKLFGLKEYRLQEEHEKSIYQEREKFFLVDNESGKRIPIRIGEREFLLEKSGSHGHFYGNLQVTAQEVAKWRNKTTNTINFTAITRQQDERQFQGKIYLIAAQGISVISDIDDTIKISEVHDRKALLANTFYRPFLPVPQMAEFYQQLVARQPDIAFHYVSGSPWQLYSALASFIDTYHFPQGSFHLRLFGWKSNLSLSFFEATQSHKLEVIEQLFQMSSQRRFILIGDSGELDAEIYATMARKYPDQVIHILIHEVPRKAGDKLDYETVFKGIPITRWTVFTAASQLTTEFLDSSNP